MATTLVNQYLGPAGTPQEIKDLRKSNYDLLDDLGSPVIFKHRWNLDDLAAGRARRCPLHDELYGNRDVSWDNICFGTGFVGGYADGVIIYVYVQDTQETAIKIGPTGVLTMDMHPALQAPWTPELGDGDLIIMADFEPGTWRVTDLHERYVLEDVSPVTMRGPGWGRQNGALIHRQRVSQQSQLDRLPLGHQLYDVPIVFDYSHVPPDPTPPYVPDPGQYGYSEFEVVANIHGIDSGFQPIPPPTPGTTSARTQDIRITGVASNPGSVVNF